MVFFKGLLPWVLGSFLTTCVVESRKPSIPGIPAQLLKKYSSYQPVADSYQQMINDYLYEYGNFYPFPIIPGRSYMYKRGGIADSMLSKYQDHGQTQLSQQQKNMLNDFLYEFSKRSNLPFSSKYQGNHGDMIDQNKQNMLMDYLNQYNKRSAMVKYATVDFPGVPDMLNWGYDPYASKVESNNLNYNPYLDDYLRVDNFDSIKRKRAQKLKNMGKSVKKSRDQSDQVDLQDSDQSARDDKPSKTKKIDETRGKV